MGTYVSKSESRVNGLLLIDSATRWPVAYPLKNLTAKAVCNCLMQLFMQTGLASGVTIASDNGSNFTAALTREFLKFLDVLQDSTLQRILNLPAQWSEQLAR